MAESIFVALFVCLLYGAGSTVGWFERLLSGMIDDAYANSL